MSIESDYKEVLQLLTSDVQLDYRSIGNYIMRTEPGMFLRAYRETRPKAITCDGKEWAMTVAEHLLRNDPVQAIKETRTAMASRSTAMAFSLREAKDVCDHVRFKAGLTTWGSDATLNTEQVRASDAIHRCLVTLRMSNRS